MEEHNECKASPDGKHCWHYQFGANWPKVPALPRCCHCGAQKPNEHGPYASGGYNPYAVRF